MCGIAGLFYFNNSKYVDTYVINAMTNCMIHRGPDDQGIYIDGSLGIGFRRLSIIDLSAAGHQPMSNEDGNLWMVANGEIYNYQELRQLLKQKRHIFKSNTDTETILHAYEEYGTDCLCKLEGMFAFAIWDKKNKTLFVARDRFGIKPLYYVLENTYFAFASEIKALKKIPEIKLEIDSESVWHYFSFMQVPAPNSIYKNIKKILPAHALVINNNRRIKMWKYWDVQPVVTTYKSQEEQIEEIRSLFEDSIRRHLVADVPVGVYLSGGFDSSTVVAYAQKYTLEPINTFSVTFPLENEFDESYYQHIVAKHFRTKHYEYTATVNLLSIAKQLIQQTDEPFAISSAIPLYLVSKLASNYVKVILSGDGADEIFAGYDWRLTKLLSLKKYNYLPKYFFSILGALFNHQQSSMWYNKTLKAKIKRHIQWGRMSDDERYLSLLSILTDDGKKLLLQKYLSQERDRSIDKYFSNIFSEAPTDSIDRYLYFDMKTFLADEMLTKVDLCTSMVSIEGRVPFLSTKLVEAAYKIPSEKKLYNGIGKQILRKSLGHLLPREILCRKKTGFTVPLIRWINTEQISNIKHALDYLDKKALEKLKNEHSKNIQNHALIFWLIWIFELWLEHQKTT